MTGVLESEIGSIVIWSCWEQERKMCPVNETF